ncbi:AMP-binding protein [Salinisphaera hydrothermalis]|uniref:AMP-binding protein n=1 Tax=Salinisphaera hydrothermalis TaxID=563188 RepID=UPI00334192DD
MLNTPLLIHEKIDENAKIYPARTAIKGPDGSITYSELDAKSDKIAHFFFDKSSNSAARQPIVPIISYPKVDLVVTLLGIMKAGYAYAIIDPSNPPRRIQSMIETLSLGRNSLIVDDKNLLNDQIKAAHFESCSIEYLLSKSFGETATATKNTVSAEDLCYVTFTSGSTGTPKAVAVKHGGWANLLEYFEQYFNLTDSDDNALSTAIGFDISQRGMFSPLYIGSCLHIPTEGKVDILNLATCIRENSISTIHCAPSTLYLLAEIFGQSSQLSSLKYAFIGGERLNVENLRPWIESKDFSCKLVHQYGVAECTDVATSKILDSPTDYYGRAVPLGCPIFNTTVHLTSDSEIAIGGRAVGAGYINLPEMTDARFRADPCNSGRLYLTGDKGRLNSNGELFHDGRIDSQVKINGMLLNLDELERYILHTQQPNQAAAVKYEPLLDLTQKPSTQTSELIAVVSTTKRVTDADHALKVLRDIRNSLTQVVPAHMLPTRYFLMNKLPISENGKTDRKLLQSVSYFSNEWRTQNEITALDKAELFNYSPKKTPIYGATPDE